MSYRERSETYLRIEEVRNRPLIFYVTSLRQDASGAISGDVVPHFIKQIQAIAEGQDEIDVMVVSHGGDSIAPWRVISLLRERFKKVGVLLPYVAYSAATLLALGADEIVMHPFSNLGPVDPQLRVPSPDGQGHRQFGAEDIRHFLEFVKEDVGISDQAQLQRAFELLANDIGSLPIGGAKRSTRLASSLGEQLLSLHMGDDSSQAKAISEALNRSFYAHSFTLGPTQAAKIGLPIVKPTKELADLLWDAWADIEDEMQCNKPFLPLQVVLENEENARILGTVRQIEWPANLPPQAMQQALQNIFSQMGVVSVPPTDFELFVASLESTRCRSEFKTRGQINAVRLPDMNINLNVIHTSAEWEFIQN